MGTKYTVEKENSEGCYIIPDWPVPSHVRSFITTRHRRSGLEPYQSFNMGLSRGDNSQAVRLNREKMRDDWHWECEPLWVKQVHGTDVVYASENNGEGNRKIQADGVWTNQKKAVCLVLTADCLPVLFCNDKGTCVASVHAGWRGLAAGVLESALHALPDKPANMMVFLGPAIGQAHFEVGPEVRDAFLRAMPVSEIAFTAGKDDRWQADLYRIARLRLKKSGVRSVYGGDFCTFSQAETFYSYRRDGKLSGHMASAVWIE